MGTLLLQDNERVHVKVHVAQCPKMTRAARKPGTLDASEWHNWSWQIIL